MFIGIIIYDDKVLYLEKNNINYFKCYKDGLIVSIPSFNIINNLRNYFINDLKLNNILDFNNYIINNGSDALLYNDSNSNNKRFFKIKIGSILLILDLVLLSSLLYHSSKYIIDDVPHIVDSVSHEYNTDYIIDSINDSTLTLEQKEYLSNRDYINFVKKYSIDDNYALSCKYYDIHVSPFDGGERDNVLGYYNPLFPDELRLRYQDDYSSLSHEFIHLTQYLYCHYNFFIESCADILNKEFYTGYNKSYTEEVKRCEALMEIVGPEPILKIIFSNDDSMFKDSIRPYLLDDTEKFCEFLKTYSTKDGFDTSKFLDEYDAYISRLYKAKYNDDIMNNNIIWSLYNNKLYFYRGYFNKDYINKNYDSDKVGCNIVGINNINKYITDDMYYYFNTRQDITYEEYRKLILDEDEIVSCNTFIDDNVIIEEETSSIINISKDDILYSLDTAVELGFVSIDNDGTIIKNSDVEILNIYHSEHKYYLMKDGEKTEYSFEDLKEMDYIHDKYYRIVSKKVPFYTPSYEEYMNLCEKYTSFDVRSSDGTIYNLFYSNGNPILSSNSVKNSEGSIIDKFPEQFIDEDIKRM